jgi:hypothetical protein
MTSQECLRELKRFEGKQIIDCIDDIRPIAEAHGFTVNVIDPVFNTASIDKEPDRLNVRTDVDSVITQFTIG